MYVRVRVQPGAKREIFEQVSDVEFRIAVREKAERNLANGRVRELLARNYGLEEKRVRLVSGHRSPNKIFDITK
ncbi:MAG: hypothetical protein G01um101448_811 [Parcubacteria group bacterium Gr01-1014_48]|nr:MAG: hypothetical protein Greene041614_1217 [Parcubacteria group bacterium Greene0416_14]TSC73318.1 MAG: hypothetical protein G01um101448_811 [Parcubacteria group bacterium Gr01-1014_48]TSC99945.1 MAG: hypothetical protein Greene101415_1015 [Parcubacteria group bacterium Greene1014_15]TSD07417.1 MAG: hypothetical protein Greene07144_909 [Parcubacteria group bacterium Greene0714_4]